MVVASRVAPTYRLTYEEVDELLSLGLDEEPELRTLLEEAHRRHDYRYEQVGETVLYFKVCLCFFFLFLLSHHLVLVSFVKFLV
jgi:hypothetical protein